jgi:CheY-like chemotaxis protein
MNSKRILIVDDESSFTHLLRLMLESTGNFHVEEVNDSRRAIEIARAFKPDIAFLDVVMPDVDGGDVATQLRADPEFAALPIVFLTAIVSPTEAHEAHIGGFPFLAKPVSVDAVMKAIEMHCPGADKPA